MKIKSTRPAAWKIVAAFAVIYLVWGSTFLAIRVGVLVWPPLLMASLRFVCAGALVMSYAGVSRATLPSRQEWRSLLILAFLQFVVDYGLLFWAERRVASGVAAVMLATIPGLTALGEILILRTQKMTALLGAALLVGIAGVAVLVWPAGGIGSVAVDRWGALALLVGAASWSLAAVLSKRLRLPESRVVSSGAQMLMGGLILLPVSGALGEWRGFRWTHVPPAGWWSLLYLVFAGSILGFTAYVWLMHHLRATIVGTYAYVNPVVAVALGFVFLHEPLSARTLTGTLCVLLSVVLITAGQRRPASR